MNQHLLIVDDEPEVLNLVEQIFHEEYTIHRANNGKQALEVLKTTPIHVLIADQRMPGMSGLELLSEMAKTLSNADSIVKVLLSSYADVAQIVKAIPAVGLHQYVLKPLDPARLHKAVEAAKNRSSNSGDWKLV